MSAWLVLLCLLAPTTESFSLLPQQARTTPARPSLSLFSAPRSYAIGAKTGSPGPAKGSSDGSSGSAGAAPAAPTKVSAAPAKAAAKEATPKVPKKAAAAPAAAPVAPVAAVTSSAQTSASNKPPPNLSAKVDKSGAEWALLFDCDGVIVETEELHRQAYNAAFSRFGLKLPDGRPVEWTVAYYDVLQNTVGGGKPKMMHYFNKEVKAWPSSSSPAAPAPVAEEDQKALVDRLQDAKTEAYIELAKSALTRPGVVALMDAALADKRLKVGICSAATKEGFLPLVNNLLGKERLALLDVLIVGDDVPKKKPDPLIYNTARERLGLRAERCVVIEDSLVGLRAAVGAHMPCIVTYTHSTKGERFYGEGAGAKVPDLSNVSLDDIFGPLFAGSSSLLETKRDQNKEPPAPAPAAPPAPVEPKFTGWTPHMTTLKK